MSLTISNHRYKVLLLYERTCHKVSLLYELKFLIMLHIRTKHWLDVVLMLETRCVKYRCQHIVSFWLILLCKHSIK